MANTKFGVSQASKDTPAWTVNMTAIIAAVALFAPDLIDSLPGHVSAEAREWLAWGLKVLTAVSAIIAVVSGRKDPASFEYLNKKK